MRVYQNDESKVMEVLRDVQAAEKGGRFREMVKALFHWKVIERYEGCSVQKYLLVFFYLTQYTVSA